MIRSLRAKQSYFTGCSPGTLVRSLFAVPAFLSEWLLYQRRNTNPGFRIRVNDLFPILSDRRATAGVARGYYFWQDLWAAKKIFQARPAEHIDIGSRIDGFIAHLLTFMPVTVVDIRPLPSDVEGLSFVQDDATSLSRFASGSIASLSSLHVAEHFGLGRYSDPIDPDACFKFMSSLERVLAPGGTLYFSVPVGRERVEFNAHRIFRPETILRSFPQLRLRSFSMVGDEGSLHTEVDPLAIPPSEYGCGLFEFTKP